MTDEQTARLSAGTRVQSFNEKYATELATIEEYADEQAGLDKIIGSLGDAGTAQAVGGKGNVKNKNSVWQTMADTIVIYAHRGVVKAHNAGNIELEAGLDHAAFFYMEGSAAEGISRANATVNLINNNLGILTNVTAGNVTEMQGGIAAFAAVKDVPTLAVKTRKVTGTSQVGPALDKMDTYIKHCGYLVHSYFPGTEMAEEFDADAKVTVLGVKHNLVGLAVQDSVSGLPITTATAVTADGKKKAKANEEGEVTFEAMLSMYQTIIVSAPGYVSQTIIVKVIRSTHTELVVMMVKG